MSADQQLAIAAKADSDRDNKPDITSQLASEIKSSLVFQYDWQQLLSSAPVAISSLGAFYIASVSNTASQTTLTLPKDGFKYLEWPSLQANLMACSDHGQRALMTATTNFSAIQGMSKIGSSKTIDTIRTLMDPPVAQQMLKPEMMALKKLADDCYSKSKGIDDKFDEWLNHVAELYIACVSTKSSNAEKLNAANLNMYVSQVRLDSQVNTASSTGKIGDNLGKNVGLVSDAYKKVANEFPDGWEIMDREIVGALAEAHATALGQAFAAFTVSIKPTINPQAGANPFSDVAPPPLPAPKQLVPPKSDSPAFVIIRENLPYLSALNAILTKGPNNSIDWDMASDKDRSSSKSALFIQNMLQYAKQEFSGLATGDDPSNQLTDILNTAVTIAGALQAEIAKGQGFPDAASSTVTQWQQTYKPIYQNVQKLNSLAKSLPGTTAGSMPLMAEPEDTSAIIGKANAKSAAGQARIEAVQNRLATAQSSLLASERIFQKASGTMGSQQTKLTEVQDKLKQLGEGQMTFADIKAVLRLSVELIVQMKSQIINLCQSYSALDATIDAVVKYSVTPFLQENNASMSGDGNSSAYKVGNYNFADLLRSLVFHSVVIIRANLSVFGDIATMWNELSQDCIMPGLQLVDQMSRSTDDAQALSSLESNLQQWATKASDSIKEVGHKSNDAITEAMTGRMDEVEAVTKALPANRDTQQSIDAGANAVVAAATDAITTNDANRPLNKFAVRTA